MKRVGLLTSGGDCQALNATMRGVVKGLSSNLTELEVYGFMNGYKGASDTATAATEMTISPVTDGTVSTPFV